MAKDPAFLFYYDRFLSGTISMTDEEVGQYIRLMCIQANKGHVSKKDMFHICKSYDNDVCLKFTNIGGDKYANTILSEIIEQRKNYTESRRNNRKSTKKKDMNNICSTHDEHMVNVNLNVNKDLNTIEERLNFAFDEIYIDQQRMKWAHIDFDFEYRTFCEKVRGSPGHYKNHDTDGLRLAFQKQLRESKNKKNGRKETTADLATAFAHRVMRDIENNELSRDK